MDTIDLLIQKIEMMQTELESLHDLATSIKSVEAIPEIEPVEITEDIVEEVSGRDPIKRALVVGINKYEPSLNCDLQGCVNDAYNINKRLINSFHFDEMNIAILTDYKATKQNILDGLEWLVGDVVPGDELVFSFSGHGSQVPDKNGDEADSFDEIICPTDLNWDDPLTDDILAEYFKRVPVDAHLTFICDSCNSGTVSRGISKDEKSETDIRVRALLSPYTMNAIAEGSTISKLNKIGIKAFVNVPDQNHILLAGCAEDDYSAEGYFYGSVNGALTFNLCEILRENPNRTWKNIEEVVTRRIQQTWGFTQTPQLVTKPENLDKVILT